MGVKGHYRDFRYFDTAIKLTTVQGFIDLGHLTELWGYDKKTMRSIIGSYVSGNEAMLRNLREGKEIIVYFTEEEATVSYHNQEPIKEVMPKIQWFVNDENKPGKRWENILNIKDKKIGVFEELNQLSDEAFQLWKELR